MLVIWAKSGLHNLTRRKDVLAMLPTGFGKSIIFQLFLCVVTYPYIWKAFAILWRNVIKNRCFPFVFDHERPSRTVKTTRVLGCNQRNRKRIGRERGKIAFAFLKNCSRKPWELASQIMDVGTRRGKIGPAKGGSGFRWSPSVTVVPLGPSSLEYSSSTLESYKTRDSLSV